MDMNISLNTSEVWIFWFEYISIYLNIWISSSIGTVTYVPDRDAIVWSIKQLNGSREYLMRAHFGLPSIDSDESEDWKAPIQVQFEIPYFTVSGIQVRYLKIIEKSGYQALPWVRYITQNGDYQLRMS